MSFLSQIDLGETSEPFVFFRSNFGFVPNLFRAQTLLPRALEVETELTNILLVQESALSATRKQCILFLVGAARQSTYCVTLHWETLRSLGITNNSERSLLTTIQPDFRKPMWRFLISA
jgi:AhpD family alkylhydroperoxidase